MLLTRTTSYPNRKKDGGKYAICFANVAPVPDYSSDPDIDGGWVRVVIRMPATLTQPSPAVHEPTPAEELV